MDPPQKRFLSFCGERKKEPVDVQLSPPGGSKTEQVSSDVLVGQSGLEPPTSRLSVVCSSQLSYWPVGGDKRTRTDDPLLAKQVLYQLSYTPIVPFAHGMRPLN